MPLNTCAFAGDGGAGDGGAGALLGKELTLIASEDPGRIPAEKTCA